MMIDIDTSCSKGKEKRSVVQWVQIFYEVAFDITHRFSILDCI